MSGFLVSCQHELDLNRKRVDPLRMNTKVPGRIYSSLLAGIMWLSCFSLAQAAAPAAPHPVPMGDNTYSLTREANSLFTRDVQKLKNQAVDDATKFCTSHGKIMKQVSLNEVKPFYGVDFVKAVLVFKELEAGDPELTSDQASARPAHDLYSELIKLDDLKKKGILTEAEFEAEKKKVLDRSK